MVEPRQSASPTVEQGTTRQASREEIVEPLQPFDGLVGSIGWPHPVDSGAARFGELDDTPYPARLELRGPHRRVNAVGPEGNDHRRGAVLEQDSSEQGGLDRTSPMLGRRPILGGGPYADPGRRPREEGTGSSAADSDRPDAPARGQPAQAGVEMTAKGLIGMRVPDDEEALSLGEWDPRPLRRRGPRGRGERGRSCPSNGASRKVIEQRALASRVRAGRTPTTRRPRSSSSRRPTTRAATIRGRPSTRMEPGRERTARGLGRARARGH